MARTDSFYQYKYDWQNIPRNSLLSTLLKSCHRIMNTSDLSDFCALIDPVILQLHLDGYYRLEICSELYIKHFQSGRQISYNGLRPQKGCENSAIKVVELERAIIFKMHFIQLYLSKPQEDTQTLEDNKDVLLLWLMHLESLCLKASLQNFLNLPLSTEQQIQANSMNFHSDLNVNLRSLTHQATQMYDTFNERVMSLLTPAECIHPSKYQQLLTNALVVHQEQLIELVQQQYGLFNSTKRVLAEINQVM